jgi:peptidoglycan/LPS O-acetylase OafA/YrhL
MEKTGSRKQLFQLNWVRAVAAIMVVGYHLEITMELPKYFGTAVFSLFRAGSSGVELFFVLSGFVIYYAHYRDPSANPDALRKFVFKRFRRIYPPLWIVLIVVGAMAVASHASSQLTPWNVIASFMILPLQSETLLGVEWTLRQEMLFYALFLVFIWDRKIGFGLLLAWGAIGSIVGVFIDEPWWLKFALSPYHLLFLAGMGIAWLYVHKTMQAGKIVFTSGLLVFGGTWWMVCTAGLVDMDYIILLFGLGAAAIIYGLIAMPLWNRPVKLLDIMGASSYSLYLVHYPLLSAMLKAAVIAQHHVTLPLSVYFLGTLAACQLAGVFFHYQIEKPIIDITSRFLQRQPKPA